MNNSMTFPTEIPIDAVEFNEDRKSGFLKFDGVTVMRHKNGDFQAWFMWKGKPTLPINVDRSKGDTLSITGFEGKTSIRFDKFDVQ